MADVWPHFIPDGITPTVTPAEGGFPQLYEWINLTNGGLSYVWAATAGDPSFVADDTEYADCLFGFTPGAPEARAEQQARYERWLQAIHPSEFDRLMAVAADLVAQIEGLAQVHVGVSQQIMAMDPTASVPGVDPALVAQVSADDPSLIGDLVPAPVQP